MSTDHNSFSTTDSDDDFFEVAMTDDTDKQMMKMVLRQQQMLLGAAKSSFSGSKRRKYVERDPVAVHARLVNDYFTEQPLWSNKVFHRRFRMQRELYLRIVNALESHDEYFHWRVDVTSRKCFSPHKKGTVDIRQLAYGWPADHHDEYLRVAETTAIDCLFNFCRCVIEVFGERYLRRASDDDKKHLVEMHLQRHGISDMLGSLDCMHWECKNCPVAWKGKFTRGDHGVPTIMLEAVTTADLWIWHAFFGITGPNNDINVLNQSLLFNDVLQENAPEISFTINGMQYKQGYYLTDVIYPEWAAFVKSFSCPQDSKRKKFKEM